MLFERPDFFEKGFYSTQILFCKFIILLDQHPQSSHSHAIFTAPTSLLTLKMFSDPLKRFLPPVKLCLWLNLLSTPSPIFSSCLVACSLGYTPPPPKQPKTLCFGKTLLTMSRWCAHVDMHTPEFFF